MRHRNLLCAAAVTTPAIASANGAMGLGLERWDLRYWYAYVLATLIAEAWLIGRWIGYSWSKSLGLSAIGNAVTGLM